jgi:phage terminase large subunit
MQLATRTIDIGDCYLPLVAGAHRGRFIMIEGPRGTGKTRAILSLLLLYAITNPGARIILIRSTRTRLSQSVLVTLEQQVFPSFGMAVPGGAGTDNRHEYKLPNGSVIIPIGMDDIQRLQSVEAAQIYVAEAVEIPTRSEVESIAGALRQAGMPHHRCYVDCNPGAPGHWLNQAAEPLPKGFRRCKSREDYDRISDHNWAPAKDGYWKRIITRHEDNPAYFDVSTWTWTKAGLEYVGDVLGTLTGHLGRRWKDGEWVAAEGTVFPEFDEDRHVIAEFRIPDGTRPGENAWPQYVFVDPGYDHPCAILWFAVGPNGCYYLIDELYRGGLSIGQHAKDIHAKNAGRTVLRYFGDPQHAFSQTAQSPESIAEQFRKCGIPMSPWPRSLDKEAMVSKVRERLLADRLKVFPGCRNTINEFQSWSYKRDAKGLVPKGDDAFEDANNHAMDCVCGAVDLNLGFDARPIKVVRA